MITKDQVQTKDGGEDEPRKKDQASPRTLERAGIVKTDEVLPPVANSGLQAAESSPDPRMQMARDTPAGAARPHVQEPNPHQWTDPKSPVSAPQELPSQEVLDLMQRRRAEFDKLTPEQKTAAVKQGHKTL